MFWLQANTTAFDLCDFGSGPHLFLCWFFFFICTCENVFIAQRNVIAVQTVGVMLFWAKLTPDRFKVSVAIRHKFQRSAWNADLFG